MATVDYLNKKIEVLKDALSQLSESDLNEKNKLEAEIAIIEECQRIFGNDDAMRFFDFSKSINVLESHNYSIDNLSTIISDIQNVLIIRKDLNMTSDDIPLEENQTSTLNMFIEKLQNVKDELTANLNKITANAKVNKDDRKIESLENLKNILEGNGKRKYYSEEMFRDFYSEFDLLNMSLEEANDILEGFYQTRNMNSRLRSEPANFEDVVELYKIYYPQKGFGYFERLLNDYKNEIINAIDLDNAKEILQFFDNNKVIEKFDKKALLQITVYGRADYIKNEMFNKVMSNKPEDINTFFRDDLSSVWIKEVGDTSYKSVPFRVSRKRNNEDGKEHLYASCQKVDYEEFWKNIDILNENSYLFSEKFNPEDLGLNLRVKTMPTWKLKKNLEFIKLFKLGREYPIAPTALDTSDFENKVHLGVELGLLNPPMTHKFSMMDEDIVRNEEFQNNCRKKGLYNQSIRNYYPRNMLVLGITPVNNFAIMMHKIQNEGYLSFYNDFFSDLMAGKQSSDKALTDEDNEILASKEKMDEFIDSKFACNSYADFIENYDEYDEVINEYTDGEKLGDYNEDSYIDSSILTDPLIINLEEKNTINDSLQLNGNYVSRVNEYVYMFGDTIISRFKVLHNAVILKNQYGYLSKDMLMTAIVRNSFLDYDSLDNIYSQVVGRGRKQ